LTLRILAERLAVCRLQPGSAIPSWLLEHSNGFWSITSSVDELSIVCNADIVPAEAQAEFGWMVFKVDGPLDFGLVGVLAGVTAALAKAGVSLFAISTYDTDYILVKTDQREAAVQALLGAGYRVLE
jgi:hypothetical protein